MAFRTENAARLPELRAVVEAPSLQNTLSCPWLTADIEPFSFVKLSGAMTMPEVGTVMAQVVGYNRVSEEGLQDANLTGNDLLIAVTTADTLILPGGIQASTEDRAINPGCCCGLESWRDLQHAVYSRQPAWMGHDPFVTLEFVGDTVRFWSDGGHEPAPDAWSIDFGTKHFLAQLRETEQDLQAFLALVEVWAIDAEFHGAKALCHKIGTDFDIFPKS